ncbi:hypothetical protein [Alkalibacter saccharofermentans]|uniref:Uncharacterized protein n=1 Tax=Alkalibacter saccharofermentans DSM 14828 TaxID=1120975 RepID=A0A1M4Y0S8_9FIRM|nr:hypothetical protein [Alkalibacter saccharofermentans]SHE99082.1 hypothetical protein SAMN02746064_01644 [Alkalibacter saccharofermentans DSM 14828]
MSLFLGKIHYWLYNKINWFESLELDILAYATKKGMPAEGWSEEIYTAYGYPTGNRPLEEIIDTGNIHGWLQYKIQRAEGRHAAFITKILDSDPSSMAELKDVFAKQGHSAASSLHIKTDSPEGAFNALNDFLLEGMPCDRVNEVLASDDNELTWESTLCLHESHWENVGGDVANFYKLRDEWIMAFVETLSDDLTFKRLSGNTQSIRREAA